MKFITRPCLLAAFLVSILFTQAAQAIIIDSYTAFFQDGSQLVVDLKKYDYGIGSYHASPTAWNEPPFPPVEGFDTFFYPSLALQQLGITPGLIGDSFGGFGLDFMVDEYYGVSMTSFAYLFQAPDWTIGDYGIRKSRASGYRTSRPGMGAQVQESIELSHSPAFLEAVLP